jgi:hypothetical protein
MSADETVRLKVDQDSAEPIKVRAYSITEPSFHGRGMILASKHH